MGLKDEEQQPLCPEMREPDHVTNPQNFYYFD